MAVRAIRAEARRSQDRGICSRSPVVLQRQAAYGKRNSQLRCGFSVFSFQCSVFSESQIAVANRLHSTLWFPR